MIDSAFKLRKSIENGAEIGKLRANYSMSYIRLYHMKNDGKHVFTVFLYDRNNKIVERHQIILPCKFNLEYLRKQIEKENIKPYVPEYAYLDILEEPEMTKKELRELFDKAYEAGWLLTGEAWNQFVIDKIAENGEVFYKYFSIIKREISHYEELNISDLQDEYYIYFKYLFSPKRMFSAILDEDSINNEENDAIRIKDKEQLISLYNKTEDEERKAVLYEILYDL